MNEIGIYRLVAHLKAEGLSELEIGIRFGVRQWTVSRMLKLRGLTDPVMTLFENHGMTSFAALLEVADWPAEVQRQALPDLERLVRRSTGRSIRRLAVATIMMRHGRDLDRDPFPTATCRACAKRTGAQADFFGGVAAGKLGRCRDAACFARCLNAVAARRARWACKNNFQAIPPGDKKRKVKK